MTVPEATISWEAEEFHSAGSAEALTAALATAAEAADVPVIVSVEAGSATITHVVGDPSGSNDREDVIVEVGSEPPPLRRHGHRDTVPLRTLTVYVAFSVSLPLPCSPLYAPLPDAIVQRDVPAFVSILTT